MQETIIKQFLVDVNLLLEKFVFNFFGSAGINGKKIVVVLEKIYGPQIIRKKESSKERIAKLINNKLLDRLEFSKNFNTNTSNSSNSISNKIINTNTNNSSNSISNKIINTNTSNSSNNVNNKNINSISINTNNIVCTKNNFCKKCSKCSLIACTPKEIWEIAIKLKISETDVREKHTAILELLETGEFQEKYKKHKTVFWTLTKWLRMSKEKGYITELNDDVFTTLKNEPPEKKEGSFRLMQEAIKRGIL